MIINQRLFREFPVIVRTQYHFQIEVPGRGYHNIYIGKRGMSVQYYGERAISYPRNVDELIRNLKRYNYENSDMARLRYLEGFVTQAKKTAKTGIFVDAGFRDGIGRIAVLNLRADESFDLYSGPKKEYPDNIAAELNAVNEAMIRYPPPDDTPIYSDCKSIAGGRVVWIPRDMNKEADTFANMRSRDDSSVQGKG